MRIRRPRGQKKTTCSKCDMPIEETRKGQKYCKACHAKNMRENRPTHSELKPEAKLKATARSYAKVYLKRGKIVKLPCAVCGDENSQMHHEDYSKPIEVIWLCRTHHLEEHKKTVHADS